MTSVLVRREKIRHRDTRVDCHEAMGTEIAVTQLSGPSQRTLRIASGHQKLEERPGRAFQEPPEGANPSTPRAETLASKILRGQMSVF